jgi:hypothetical protein
MASSVKHGSHVICFLFIIYKEEGIHYGYLHDGARARLVRVASNATGQDRTVSPSVCPGDVLFHRRIQLEQNFIPMKNLVFNSDYYELFGYFN